MVNGLSTAARNIKARSRRVGGLSQKERVTGRVAASRSRALRRKQAAQKVQEELDKKAQQEVEKQAKQLAAKRTAGALRERTLESTVAVTQGPLKPDRRSLVVRKEPIEPEFTLDPRIQEETRRKLSTQPTQTKSEDPVGGIIIDLPKPRAGTISALDEPFADDLITKGSQAIKVIGRQEVAEEPNFFKRVGKALESFSAFALEKEKEKSFIAPILIAGATSVLVPKRVIGGLITNPIKTIDDVLFSIPRMVINPVFAARSVPGRVGEIAGGFIGGSALLGAGRAGLKGISAPVKAIGRARFARRIRLRPDQRTPILVMERTTTSLPGRTAGKPITPLKASPEIQTILKRGGLKKAPKPPQFKQESVTRPAIQRVLTTDKPFMGKQLRFDVPSPGSQFRFVGPKPIKPSTGQRIAAIRKRFPPGDPRRLALESAIITKAFKSKRGQVGLAPELIFKRPTPRFTADVPARTITSIARRRTPLIPIFLTPTITTAIVGSGTLLRSRQLPGQESIPKSIVDLISEATPAEDVVQRQEQASRAAIATRAKQIALSASALIPLVETIPVTTTETILRPIPPIPPPRPSFLFADTTTAPRGAIRTPAKLKDAFDTFVRERGRQIKINERPLPFNRALNQGLDVADNTPTVTVTLKPTGRRTRLRDDPSRPLAFKFFSTKKNQFREFTRHRIDTRGELAGITVKGFLASQRAARRRRSGLAPPLRRRRRRSPRFI